MKITKKQMIWIGLLIVGVLLYLLFIKKNKKGSIKNDEKNSNENKSLQEDSYIGAQDCIELCENTYQRQLKVCYDKYNGLEGTKECLDMASSSKLKCMTPCTNSYPTKENFNANIKDNFKAILERDTNEVDCDGSIPLPSYYDLRLKIDVSGKKSVFPFQIIKKTEGAMELPNRRSLLNQNIKYRYIDVNQNDKINIVSLINLSYTVDHFAFNDDFLLTDKDYVISYSQAVQHFKMISK